MVTVVLSGLGIFFSAVVADAWPAGTVLADSFNANGSRAAGASLIGTATEGGIVPWQGGGSLVIAPNGGLTVSDASGAMAAVPVAQQTGIIAVEADIVADGADFVGIGFTATNDAAHFWDDTNAAVVGIIKQSGNVDFVVGGKPQGSTDLSASGSFQAGSNHVRVEYDFAARSYTFTVNGKQMKGTIPPSTPLTISSAVIYFNAPVMANHPLVKNFVLIHQDSNP
jgi:hypothetical protein